MYFLAVQPRHQVLFGNVSDLVRGDDPRAEAAGVGEILARGVLAGMALPLAHAAVVVAGIAGDHRTGVGRLDVPAGPSDHHRQFALVIQRRADVRADQRLPVAHLRVGPAGEDRRLLRRLAAAFADVRQVVQPDADDLVRVGDGRQEGHFVEPPRCCRRREAYRHRQRRLQPRRVVEEVAHRLAVCRSPAWRAVGTQEAHQAHGGPSLVAPPWSHPPVSLASAAPLSGVTGSCRPRLRLSWPLAHRQAGGGS